MASTDTRERRSADDPEVRSQVLGSGDPEVQEEARRSVIEEVGEENYNADPERFWTAQQGPMPDIGRAAALGPQLYLEAQLPDPNVAKAGNITPQRIPEGLVLSDDDAWDHPKGPEPGEQVRLLKNEAVNQRLINETPSSGRDYLVLTSGSLNEIRRAQERDEDQGGDDKRGGSDDEADKTKTDEAQADKAQADKRRTTEATTASETKTTP